MFHRPKRKYLPGFVPPRPSRSVIALCKALLDPIMNLVYDIKGVDVDPAELQRFLSHRGERMVLVPNHPSHGDPAVLFKLSKIAKEDWYYLSNREQFDRWFGLYGRLLQRCGTYTLARGTMDKASFLTTKRLLTEGPNKLVIFAEGGNYSWNDLEAPFQEGLFKLILMAASELRERKFEGPLWIQPVALKYVYGPSAERAMERSLVRLEEAVGLTGEPPAEFRERVLRIGARIVGTVERGFFGKEFGDDCFHDRIVRVREEMLHRFAQALGAPTPDSGSLLERTRVLFDSFHRVSTEGSLPKTEYEETLFDEDILAMRSLRHQLDRLENWAALKEGYLEGASLERRVEVVTRLEREVFKGIHLHPKRRCAIRLGEPFDLMQYVPEGGRPAKDAARLATREAEARVRDLLHS